MIAALAALADRPSELRGLGHMRGHETDRLAALYTELSGLGCEVVEHADGLTITPAPLHGGTWHAYADHRMATAGAVLGPGRRRRRDRRHRRARPKTLPDFPGMWSATAGRLTRMAAQGPRASTRTTSARAPTRAAPGRAPSSARRTTTPRAGMVFAVDRGRYGVLVDGRRGHRDAGPRARPRVDRRRRPGRGGRRPVRRARRAGAHRPPRRARDRAAPHGRRQRPARAGDRRQRRPAGHRLGAGRPRAVLRLHRPLPGRRADRGHRAAAVPDQVRPRAARRR